MKKKIAELIAGLQTLENGIAQYDDLRDRTDKAKIEHSAAIKELTKVRAEANAAVAESAMTRIDTMKRHDAAIAEHNVKLSQLQTEISAAEARLAEVEATIPEKRKQYESYVLEISEIQRRLG